MEVTGQDMAIAIAATAAVTSLATLRWNRAVQARKEAKEDALAAEKKGAETARLNGVIEDVARLATVEVPEIRKLTNQNALAIAGLTAVTAGQAVNIDRLTELHKERTRLVDVVIEKLLEDK